MTALKSRLGVTLETSCYMSYSEGLDTTEVSDLAHEITREQGPIRALISWS